ncbi:hypothetical protein [Streptomyces bikiniensis]|nr:hypothetical protein [Streptomyces bikiniensis]
MGAIEETSDEAVRALVETKPDLVRRELDRWRHAVLSTGVAETVR